jgi:hypothetical protein
VGAARADNPDNIARRVPSAERQSTDMIKSSSAEVRGLIGSLGAGDAARREAAIARLIIIGDRAVGQLVTTYTATPDRETQLAILRVLEASADERALPIARRALANGGDVSVAAVGILRDLLSRGAGSAHTEALELLLTLTADPAVERRVRAAAAEALDAAPDDIRRAVQGTLTARPSTIDALWEDAAEGRLPDDPALLREAAARHAEHAPLPVLHRLIEFVRDRERTAPQARAEAWLAVRGSLHQALALRGSRIALYDLRESFESATGPLPASFLAAVQVVGDASCLETIAAAFSRSAGHDRWRHQLAQAFKAVVRREHLTRRSPAIRRALAKAPDIGRL